MSKSPNIAQACATGQNDSYLQAVADAAAESKPETVEQHFARKETPSRYSPIGNTMVRILAKYPGMSFEQARAHASQLLNQAAGRRSYQAPAVLSAEEQRNRLERLKTRFKPPVLPLSSKASTTKPARHAQTVNEPTAALEIAPTQELA